MLFSTVSTARRTIAAALCLTAAVFASHAQAQNAASYPSKAIHIIVPYPTGGFNDTLGRLVGNKLSQAWGQPVVVDNKPGGGTVIGSQFVANSPADGYTLLVVQFPFATNPLFYKLPYDSAKAFAPVVLAGRSPMLVVTHAGSTLKSLGDVLSTAKSKPGSLNYGSSGAGSSNHLAMALFENLSGTRMTQVPYKGSTPLMIDLAGGQLDLAVDLLPQVLPFIQSGKVRALAIGAAKRSPLMPDVPTAAELGVPGYEVSSWHGFMVPAGTPQPVIDKLNKQINAILAMDDIKKAFAQQGVVPDGGTPAQFQAYIASQSALWGKVVQERHITAE